MPETVDLLRARIELLNAIGIALSRESDPAVLRGVILDGALALTGAEAGSVYAVDDDAQVRFVLLRNVRLGDRLPALDGLPSIPLHAADGSENHASVVAHCVLTGNTVAIADAYAEPGFDFRGTRAFDARTGYRSVSFLTVPMRDHEGVIVGVLQLINARPDGRTIAAFSRDDIRLAESLASQAATAASKHRLIAELHELFASFIRMIAGAIDAKSPYTGGHCRRVPELVMLLAEAAAACREGLLADFQLSAADRYEISVAAWLHDCGKITTPESVMDKATKLSGIHDRIELIATRFAAASAQAELAALRTGQPAPNDAPDFAAELAFLRKANTGSERMSDADQARVHAIAARTWIAPDGQVQPLLTADEVRCLTIVKGTLLPEERAIINHHISATIAMLDALPFPRHLRRVPEYAGGHHERMDGKGYPKGLTGAQMSVPARIMAIADIFEALTAGDRPYKKAMPLSNALAILDRMSRDGHIDPDLFHIFMHSGVWRTYAQRFLPAEQVDM